MPVAGRAGTAPPQRGYTELEEEQVRQVLAESGYPDPSHEDIDLVLRHMRLYELQPEHGRHGSSDGSQGVASDDDDDDDRDVALAPPSALQGSHNSSSGRHISKVPTPTASQTWRVRSHRGVPLAWDTSTHVAHPRVQGRRFPCTQPHPPSARHDDAAAASSDHARSDDVGEAEVAARRHRRVAATTQQPSQQQQQQQSPSQPQPPLLRHSRRDANVLFDMTGDGRYRYRLTTVAAMTPREAVAVAPPHAHGGVYAARASERCRGQTLSRYSVAHLAADGSTLQRRADPVRRGEAMRALWQRDDFLAQRGRREEVWRMRQAMMRMLPCDDATVV